MLTKNELKWATILALTTPPKGTPKPPKPKPYLTFHSEDGEFTLRVYDGAKHWDGTLEWSTDTETWTVWPGTSAISSNDGYLYLRGTGNSIITGSFSGSWQFRYSEPGERVACLGNIECLLDYTLVMAGIHPVMAEGCYSHMFDSWTTLIAAPEMPATDLADYCYECMFQYCRSLTIAPELPAVSLSEGCYKMMFNECSSLTNAPALPATTLTDSCYSYMFQRCTSLTSVPELPATTLFTSCCSFMFAECTSLENIPELPATMLPASCYSNMFRGCTSVKLSLSSDETYKYPYRIPTEGVGAAERYALVYMFSSTGGPFTGTPDINTTYYTDHEPV